MSAKDHLKEHDHPVVQDEGHTGKLKNVGDIHPFHAASEPYPLPEDTKDTPPWAKAEFKRRVLSAGFPGSPASDDAFLQALYKFGGGKVEEPKEEHKEPPKEEHKHK